MADAVSIYRRGKIGSVQQNRRIAQINSTLALLATKVAKAATAPVNAVASVLSTSMTGDNNDLTITAKTKGVVGDSITIALVDPGEDAEAEVVTVTGTDIVVTLRSATGTLSTAAEVKAAIEASAAAAALVTVAFKGTDTGAGNVTALTETPLASGVDGTVGTAWEARYNGGYLYLCASDAGNTISGANWVKAQFVAA
jgi:hypothetical protein